MVTTSHGGAPALDPIALAALRRSVRGELLTPAAPGYDAARRLASQRHAARPALIIRCHTSGDVALAVVFARERDLAVAVRGGVHGAACQGADDGGLLIDLTQMRHIAVDPMRRVARAHPGATNAELVLAAAAYGLAPVTGAGAGVHVVGSALGDDHGWLAGRFGGALGSVAAVELVAADGATLTASPAERPELFGAVRAGSAPGIVTAITCRLHPLGPVLGGPLIFPLAEAGPALRAYRDLTARAPDELTAGAVLGTLPALGPALTIQAVYAGDDLAAGERLLAPLRDLGPAMAMLALRAYAECFLMLAPGAPPGASRVEERCAAAQLSDAAIDALLATAATLPSPHSTVAIQHVHGAAARVPPEATAFALREPHYAVANVGMWLEGDGAAETRWGREAVAHMAPYASRGLYVNF